MDISDRKQELRERLLERRSHIPENQYLGKSAAICSHVTASKIFQQAQTIHCYVSMNKRREVNTHDLIKAMLKTGKKVVVPVTQVKTNTLRHVGLNSIDDLEKNDWGVPEPVDGEEVPVGEFDLVIVPMLAGDKYKNRLGYGKGFYDRFLAEVDCPTVGLLFKGFLVDEIPVEPFDVALNKLITEDGFLE